MDGPSVVAVDTVTDDDKRDGVPQTRARERGSRVLR